MNRFYCVSVKITGDKASLTEESVVHHIRDVLRLKPGEEMVVFDQAGCQFKGVIKAILPREIIVRVKEIIPAAKADHRVKICVACAIPKRSKFDDIIDKLTQLGVDRIIPMITERVVVKMEKEKQEARKVRWAKIALAASQQSQRSSIPLVEKVMDFGQVMVLSSGFDMRLIPTLPGKRKAFKDILEAAKPENIMVLIGPEGDFSEDETAAALRSGFIPVSLGDLVMRVETAAVYVAAILNYELSCRN
ncbi:MAG: RsmE family RNA methyltransferase [Candidatus Omnitrophica bacterium]|jgi:16S rRNA (uracil1498-N3)-methyltransferase|nr:16S rRNA (uracil(1498)-N(3))-methyltransferase [Candidatus Omnitrophota bacterium]MDD5078951.1 RsmE family RNA methyltransferase [Candidatus Omnitrophota bacterium]